MLRLFVCWQQIQKMPVLRRAQEPLLQQLPGHSVRTGLEHGFYSLLVCSAYAEAAISLIPLHPAHAQKTDQDIVL